MGAIGSAAPWFLTGWAQYVEVEFMIDTGCELSCIVIDMCSRHRENQ